MKKKNRSVKRRRAEIPTVPKQYGGQWVAWNRDGTQIIAHADTLDKVMALAESVAAVEPGFEWIPPASRRIMEKSVCGISLSQV